MQRDGNLREPLQEKARVGMFGAPRVFQFFVRGEELASIEMLNPALK